ncbi:endoplasmic reticulum membrane protein [Nosema bombycis CQ1]|uniref:Endoplasmic reticulum membrane protein n=1 Tax=Nosema bombycis (strain CQ1 / CVCC 102059) TaxID=578461 RepID=R0M1P8_NOSB1|nr:endoplasmic reticulum membrane protein [Nosema bombycis CQ1]|eukprot:EOB11929.1 endoplasmic reticulum membrane protein [Nosema bombycis CQ1]
MRFLFLVAVVICRYVEIGSKETFIFKDVVTKDNMYKFIYRAFDSSSVYLSIFDSNLKKIIDTTDPYGVLYTKSNIDGYITIRVTNPHKEVMKFGYKCPDVKKELQGPLGPIKDVDTVNELQSVLQSIIQTQRDHIRSYQSHSQMLDKSRRWVFRLVILEIVSSIIIMYYLHKSTLDMFSKKKITQ